LIRDRGVALRYATALFGAAVKRGEMERVLEDTQALLALHRSDSTLQNFLEAPNLLDSDKDELLERTLRGRITDLVLQFIRLMLRKKRVQHLPLVYDHFRRMVEDALGQLRAIVTTAVPLDDALGARLRAALERTTGKQIVLDARIDRRILGGVVVTVGGKILDGSVRYRLDRLRDELLQVRVA